MLNNFNAFTIIKLLYTVNFFIHWISLLILFLKARFKLLVNQNNNLQKNKGKK